MIPILEQAPATWLYASWDTLERLQPLIYAAAEQETNEQMKMELRNFGHLISGTLEKRLASIQDLL